MKRQYLMLILSIVIFTMLFTACGANNTAQSEESSENDSTVVETSFSAENTNTIDESTSVSESTGLVREDKGNGDYDFKEYYWGDSRATVEANEGVPESEGTVKGLDAEYICYSASVAGKNAILAYYFSKDGLYETRYIITENHSNESLYIDDYEDIKQAISKKYGEPSLDNQNWTDNDKKSYYAGREYTALSYGYLSYYTAFMTPKTLVTMDMSADNYVISTIIYFTSLELSPGEADYLNDF